MPDSDNSSTTSRTPGPKDVRNNRSTSEGYFESISPSAKSTSREIPNSSQGSSSGSTIRERRSSLSLGLDSLRHAGGVNSIENFARSWTRAAGYFEITPARSYVSISSTEDQESGREDLESALLDEEDNDLSSIGYGAHRTRDYGSISANMPRSSMPVERFDDPISRHAAELFNESQRELEVIDKEREPLLVKTVEREDGVLETTIVGQSTLPQTVFNSVNVLIGVGLLSLPLGIRYSGWLIGMSFLLAAAIVTNYTAKILARCLDKSPNQALVTYSDIAYIAYGEVGRVLVSALFLLELVAACVALVVLFADSLADLIPSISILQWKIISFFVFTPLAFLPLRVLSLTSVLGILSTLSIFIIIVINGFLKPDAPGSLREPMPTYWWPESWWTVPLSLGLLMSPWGGHGVFPNIYKDMRHPYKYDRAVNYTFVFTYVLDAAMAAVGLLMFGDNIRDELTANIIATVGYPEALKVAMVVFVAIIPVTKTPLNARPIISTLELVTGVNQISLGGTEGAIGMSSLTRSIIRIAIKVGVNIFVVILAILVPGFDSIMSFLGSALCFAICIILPLLFYLRIFGDEVSPRERFWDWVLIIISSCMALVGTAFTFIPKEKLLSF